MLDSLMDKTPIGKSLRAMGDMSKKILGPTSPPSVGLQYMSRVSIMENVWKVLGAALMTRGSNRGARL